MLYYPCFLTHFLLPPVVWDLLVAAVAAVAGLLHLVLPPPWVLLKLPALDSGSELQPLPAAGPRGPCRLSLVLDALSIP